MNLAPILLDRLAETLLRRLSQAEVGYCIRVDHLSAADAESLCRTLRDRNRRPDVETWILGTSRQDNDLEITPEKAIEIRNRKCVRLGLIVPAGVMDAAASSLTNAFASFDWEAFWRKTTQDLLESLPPACRMAAQRALRMPRGILTPRIEFQADYLAAVFRHPTLTAAGAELWRIELIPDFGENFEDRLDRNVKCVRELVRPARAHTSANERLNACMIREGPVKQELWSYLRDKSLRDARAWMRGLAEEPHRERISFEKWQFQEGDESNLEAISVLPLVDQEGNVLPKRGFLQDGPGSQLYTLVGPKNKISIEWKSEPKSPKGVHDWWIELIPSREHYSADDNPSLELPHVRVTARSRKAGIPLDLDLSDEAAVAVQARVVARDELGNNLTDKEGRPIEGLSEEFWLRANSDAAPLPSTGERIATALNLPLGRLEVARSSSFDSMEETSIQWIDRDLSYFGIRVNNGRTIRVGLSPILRAVEKKAAEEASLVCFKAKLEGNRLLDADRDLERVELTALKESELSRGFLDKRNKFLRELRQQDIRGLVETAEWTDDLKKRAVALAEAYAKLLSEESSQAALREAMWIDTLHLELAAYGGVHKAILISPLHPLRLLWYTAYVELLSIWERELLAKEKRLRSKLVDLNLLERISPMNCPVFIPGEGADIHLFSSNLGFFWGLALPLATENPARMLTDIAQAVGFREEDAARDDLPATKVSDTLADYCKIHRYLETLRLNVWNSGGGSYVADAIRGFYALDPAEEEAADDAVVPPRLELIVHLPPPVVPALPPLTALQRKLYEVRPKGSHHHLAPFFALSLRPETCIEDMPGGDVNVSLVLDRLRPEYRLLQDDDGDNSCSALGLLMRTFPAFVSRPEGCRWEYRLRPEIDRVTAHNPIKSYTKLLVALHAACLDAVRRLTDETSRGGLPGIVVEIPRDQRDRIDAVHQLSDWVVTVDRYFGVEFYDTPADGNLAGISDKYLLDYAPEFSDGLGHRMLVTTAHREEVEEILGRAMKDLGFARVENSVGRVLRYLKTISGRLALRVLGQESAAQEAVGLGIVAAYLESQGELSDAVLVPVDSHPELFAHGPKRSGDSGPAMRCDLIRVSFGQNRLTATFIEVKARTHQSNTEKMIQHMIDQIDSTEKRFRELFFPADYERLDHVFQRARLANILMFYLQRAVRYGLITDTHSLDRLKNGITSLQSGIERLSVEKRGYIVTIKGPPQKRLRLPGAEIYFLTANDLIGAGFSEDSFLQPPERTVSPAPQAPAPAPLSADRPRSSRAEAAPSNTPLPPAPSKRSVAKPESQPSEGPPTSNEIAVELGRTLDDEPVVWRSGVRGSPHLFIVGIPGQGKSVTTTRILTETSRQGLPALVIDFHGQFSTPESEYVRTAQPHIYDAAKGLPFSPFEAETNLVAGVSGWKTNSLAVAEIFQYVCELGDIQRDVVYQALYDCYQDRGFETGAVEGIPTLEDFRKRLEELEEERRVRNVIPRCRPLLDFGLFPKDRPAEVFGLLIQRGLVFDVSQVGIDAVQKAVGAFVLRKVYKDMFRWGESNRLRLAIVLDEAHRLSGDTTLPKIMKEGRKFGVVVIVASQGLQDYHPEVLANVGTKVVFRTNHPMSRKVASFLQPARNHNLVQAIEQLDVGEAFVQTLDMTTCQRVRMHL